MSVRKVSIRANLTRLMAVASLIGVITSAIALAVVLGYFGRIASQQDLKTFAAVIADNSTAAVSFADETTASRVISAVQAKQDVSLVCLFVINPDTQLSTTPFAAWPSAAKSQCPQSLAVDNGGFWAKSLRVQQMVRLDNEPIGVLTMTQDLAPFRQYLLQLVGMVVVVVALAFFVTFGVAWRAQTAMILPIIDLAGIARTVAVSADYSLRSPLRANDEVGQLAIDFNGMLDKVQLSDAAVRAGRDALSEEVMQKTAANLELKNTLKRLTDTQKQLLQAEKMASLGGLVAGVAHEINTPLGVSVTAASTLSANSVNLRKMYTDGTMKRSDLDAYVKMTDECTRILLNNLHRAAELIQSFKRVAVDQTSDERRRFSLHAYLTEVILSLAPTLKATKVNVRCAQDIWVDSFPGALAQIITNFITNSILHGFDDGRAGTIDIEVITMSERVLLRYLDNGKGVEAEHLPRIFDPFFTTKRGSGGSGLGMHIVYNLITQRLGGTIVAESSANKGLQLLLTFPLTAPKALASAIELP